MENRLEHLESTMLILLDVCPDRDCEQCMMKRNTLDQLIKEASKEFNEV